MGGDSTSMGFHHGVMPSSAMHSRGMLSFQPAAAGFGGGTGQVGAAGGAFFAGGPAGIGAIAGPSSGSGQYLAAAAPEMIKQQDSVLSPEWTIDEQNALQQGLIQYGGEDSIMKYIKIAAMLPRKTVRDVALRCRLLDDNNKRQRLEEYYNKKRMYSRKEKMVDSCSNAIRHMVGPGTVSSFPSLTPQVHQSDLFPSEVPILDGATQQLLDDNNQILQQISNNLATYQIQGNIDLFCRARNNISTIQNNMSNMPSIMSQMPPLPVPINEELLNAILSCPSQAFMFGGPAFPLEPPTRQNNLL